MNFQELAQSRHSIRKYLPQSIETEKKETILQAALMAPASKRRNPWEFVVVEDKDMLAALSECRPHGSVFLANAAMAIVIMADTGKSDLWVVDASIAATFVQLQAHDLGLGSCWVQVYNRFRADNSPVSDYVCEKLAIPANFSVLCLIGLGYPDEAKTPFDLDKLAYEKVHNEKF